MGNMFFTDLRIHRRFDLKGSKLGRSADKVEIDENTILKDLDLNYSFFLEPSWREGLLTYFCSLSSKTIYYIAFVVIFMFLKTSSSAVGVKNRQLEIDSKFLVEQNIMDYSLLLGVHHRAPEHLRTQLVRSRSITADALESVAEDGKTLLFLTLLV